MQLPFFFPPFTFQTSRFVKNDLLCEMSYLLYHRIGSAKHRLVAVTASAEFPLEYIEEHLRAARLRSVIVNSRTAMTLVWRSLAVVALCGDDARLLSKVVGNVLTPDQDDPIVDDSSDSCDGVKWKQQQQQQQRRAPIVSISESLAASFSPCLPPPLPPTVQVAVTPQSTSQCSLIACSIAANKHNNIKEEEKEEEHVLQRGFALPRKRQRLDAVAPMPDSGSSSTSFADGVDPNQIDF